MFHIRPDVLNDRTVAESDDCTNTPISCQSRTEGELWGRRVYVVEQNELLRQGTYEYALGAFSVIASSGKPGTADSARALGKEIILTRMFNFVCCRWSTIWSVTNCSEKISEVRGQRLCKWLMIVCFIRNAKFTHPNFWSPVRRHAV